MKNSRSSSTYKLFKQERKKISGLVAQKGARLTKFVIDDDGYQIKIVVPGNSVTLKDICGVVDEIDFEGFLVNDCLYQKDGIDAVLVPISQATMNDFVWNYVGLYLDEYEEISALSTALGVLEHIIEPLPQEVRGEYERFVEVVFT